MKKLTKYYILSIEFYGAETDTLENKSEIRWKSLSVVLEKNIWIDCVKNEEVLPRVKEGRNPTYKKKKED
jgi:hypothetical protein